MIRERNRLRTSCAPAVGRGDFKKRNLEDGAVQPITAGIRCALRAWPSAHSAEPNVAYPRNVAIWAALKRRAPRDSQTIHLRRSE